jgi:hypothetical protein
MKVIRRMLSISAKYLGLSHYTYFPLICENELAKWPTH